MDAKFSPKVKEVISYSREEALRLGHDHIGTEHLLLGLIREGGGLAIKVLQSLEVNMVLLRKSVEEAIREKSPRQAVNAGSLPLTKQAEKVLKITVLEAKVLKSETIGTEHLLLSILKIKTISLRRYSDSLTLIMNCSARNWIMRQEMGQDMPTNSAEDEGFEEEENLNVSLMFRENRVLLNLKLRCSIILVEILPVLPKMEN